MLDQALMRRLAAVLLLAFFVALPGCGGGEAADDSQVQDDGPADDAEPSIVLDSIDPSALAEMDTHVFPDGTNFRFPQDARVMSGLGFVVEYEQISNMATIQQFPADGETDPRAPWILERHDEVVARDNIFRERFERGDSILAQTPNGPAASFNCAFESRFGTGESRHYITIINDRVYCIWSIGEVPVLSGYQDLAKLITRTIQPGPVPAFAFANDQPHLVGTFVGTDINRPRVQDVSAAGYAYSFHPDGTLLFGRMQLLDQQSGEDDPLLLLEPKTGREDEVEVGTWSVHEGVLTLMWNNQRRTFEYFIPPDHPEVLFIPDISGSSRQPFTLQARSAADWPTPAGAPELLEESEDAPPTRPTESPEVTDPTPTISPSALPRPNQIPFTGQSPFTRPSDSADQPDEE